MFKSKDIDVDIVQTELIEPKVSNVFGVFSCDDGSIGLLLGYLFERSHVQVCPCECECH
jgi:hypothetical protein